MSEDFSCLTHMCPLVTNERLNKALTNWFNEAYTFTHWEHVSDGNKGDGYLSETMFIRLHGVSNSGDKKFIQVVLKRMPAGDIKRLICRAPDFYRNEINFYEIALPGLLSFQATKEVEDPFNHCPKLVFAYSDGSNDIICLEDTNVEGYHPVPLRKEGIDVEHCKLTLKILAKLHALSFAMKDQEPEKFEILRNAVFETYYDHRFRGWYIDFWNRLSEIAIDAVEKEFPNSIYEEKVKQFAIPERYQDMIDASRKTFESGVILHGDSWINNVMYKYKDGQIVDGKIVDFQVTRCASPALDISYLIYSCTSQDLREQCYDELLKFYHDVLTKQIRDLGSDPSKLYPWKLFMAEVKKYFYFGLGFSFEAVPFTVCAPEDIVEVDKESTEVLNINDVWRLSNLKTKEDRLREANNVKHCVDRGYI